MLDWRELTLGDVLEVKYGKDHKHLEDGDIPLFGSGGIMRRVNKSLYTDESILIPRKGTLNNVIYCNKPFWTVDTMFYTILNSSLIIPKFVFYQLTLIDFNNLNVGSAVPSLTVPVIKEITLTLPPLPEQQAIAEVLSSLDDKIDLLHRNNKTLEEMAETLFRQWFVGGAKEDWETGTLEDLIVIRYGKDHKHLKDGDIPVFGSGGLMRKCERPLCENSSVLIPRKGTLSNVMLIEEPFWSVDTMFYTEMKRPNSLKYIFHFIKGLDLAGMNVGSAVPSMTTKTLYSIELQIPPCELMALFEEKTKPLYEKINNNAGHIKGLELLRNTLLPKLMSGQVTVNINS